MRILSIGNSFSQDAHRYIHGVAKSCGKSIDCVNLYIGGCSLETHYRNMLSGRREYSLEFNGETTGFRVSLEEALLAGHYDVITLQQASALSCSFDTYRPYLSELADFVRKYAPAAKLMMHETWAYADGSEWLLNAVASTHMGDMARPVSEAYRQAAEAISADGIIPSGTLLYRMFTRGIDNIHRDGRHVSLGTSRYALALLWTRVLTGASVNDNAFAELDEPVSEAERRIIIEEIESLRP